MIHIESPTRQQIATEKEIARRNKVFKAATNAGKRILIAKDVISLIKSKKIKAISQIFYEANPIDVLEGEGFQKAFIDKKILNCQCCAQGAMMVSCTLFNNNYTVEESETFNGDFNDLGFKIKDDFKLKNGLNKYFSKTQLALIEQAFENRKGAFTRCSPKQAMIINKFYDKNPNDKKRLLAIMKNIIDNKGKFILK